MITLLITGCIHPELKNLLTISESTVREKEYLECIEWAIESSNFSKIVYVDNSNYNFEKWIYLYQKANDKKKQLELLSFCGSKKTLEKGKGYGEGEIIQYAFENSCILKESKYFAKLTGRLIVYNINSILDKTTMDLLNKGYVLANKNFPYDNMIDTRFYIMACATYIRYFLTLYNEVNDGSGIYIEHLFNECINSHSEFNATCTVKYPRLLGRNATSGGKAGRGLVFSSIADLLCTVRLFNCGGLMFSILNIPAKIKSYIKAILMIGTSTG